MFNKKFERLLRRGILTDETLRESIEESIAADQYVEELLVAKGIPKHEILFCLAEYYGSPFTEYDEGIKASQDVLLRLDLERLKAARWFPLTLGQDNIKVITYDPASPRVIGDIKNTTGAKSIEFQVALPSDIVRIIENNQDVNPHFPQSSGRTQLAKVRTFL